MKRKQTARGSVSVAWLSSALGAEQPGRLTPIASFDSFPQKLCISQGAEAMPNRVGRVLAVIVSLSGWTIYPQHASAQIDAGKFRDVETSLQTSEGLEALNVYLRPISPSIVAAHCDMMIVAHAESVEDIYAGVCDLKSKARVMVCGDTGVGEFGLTPFKSVADAAARATLVRFTQANCPGG